MSRARGDDCQRQRHRRNQPAQKHHHPERHSPITGSFLPNNRIRRTHVSPSVIHRITFQQVPHNSSNRGTVSVGGEMRRLLAGLRPRPSQWSASYLSQHTGGQPWVNLLAFSGVGVLQPSGIFKLYFFIMEEDLKAADFSRVEMGAAVS